MAYLAHFSFSLALELFCGFHLEKRYLMDLSLVLSAFCQQYLFITDLVDHFWIKKVVKASDKNDPCKGKVHY